MSKNITTKIVLRNDSTENWQAIENSAILLKGEVGLEYNATGVKMKIGDGVSVWAKLPYFVSGGGIAELPDSFTWGDLLGSEEVGEQTTTDTLGLAKPGISDIVDITILNANADIIDTKIVELSNRVTAAEQTVASYDEKVDAAVKAAAKVDGLESRVEAAEIIVKENDAAVAELGNTVADATEKVANMETSVSTM